MTLSTSTMAPRYIIIVGASLLTASPSFMEDTDWLRAALVWEEGSRGLFPEGIEGGGVFEACTAQHV